MPAVSIAELWPVNPILYNPLSFYSNTCTDSKEYNPMHAEYQQGILQAL